tara:strand:+ start:1900 stop:2103 length:204 start_codon:yes stop_codon:yes gene_type:complete
MTLPVVSCTPNEKLTDAMATMTTRHLLHLPVVDGGKLIGIVSRDLAKYRLDELEHETTNLRAYIATA